MVMALVPPKAYDYEPKVSYEIREFHEGQEPLMMKVFCKREGKIVLGCEVNHIIFIRDDLNKEVYDVILRHEKAHVNGWKHG